MLAYIKRHIPDDDTSDLYQAVQNLTACAFQHCEDFYQEATRYADSLLSQATTPTTSPGPATQIEHFQSLAEKLADIISDPHLPAEASGILEAAATEIINKVSHDSIPLIRGSFARACLQMIADETPKASPEAPKKLTEREQSLAKIIEAVCVPSLAPDDEVIDAALKVLETGKVPLSVGETISIPSKSTGKSRRHAK